MKRRALMAFALLAMSQWAMALAPLGFKDISLMLRTGMTEQQIISDATRRKLMAPLSPDQEKALRSAGATPALLNALRSPALIASKAEINAAHFAPKNTAPPPLPPLPTPARTSQPITYGEPYGPNSPMFNSLQNSDFVSLQGDKLISFDHARFSHVRYFAIYFSASWCGPCRRFSPDLVKFYDETKPKNPQFELIFVTWDKTESAMKDYMSADQMKWPALSFDEAHLHSSPLNKYAGPGIPCLVLVDAQGNVLSNSFEGSNYVGPGKVMNDIAKILSENPPTQNELSTATH